MPNDGYVTMPGTGTSRVDVPDSAGLSLLADLDVRVLIVMTDWTPTAFQTVIAHRLTGTQESWQFGVNTTGTLAFGWSADGANETNTASTVATAGVNGSHLWLRVTHDVDNGATGNDVIYYTSADPIATAAASVTWVQLGTTVTTAAVTSHHNSTNQLELGSNSDGAANRMVGRYHYAELRSSIGGSIVGSPDFRTATQTSDGGLTFVDPQTNVWTLRTAAAWVADTAVAGASSNRLLLGVG